MPLSKSLVQIAVEELDGITCCAPHPDVLGKICGQIKRSGISFCSRCYYKLPATTRRALYNDIWHGYAEIYDEAKELLKGL